MFHTKEYLRRHVYNEHKPEESKRFFCEQCQKGFNSKVSYDGHQNMHLGLKPYKCNYCSMCYQNGPNMNAHERKTHPEEYKRNHKHAGKNAKIRHG